MPLLIRPHSFTKYEASETGDEVVETIDHTATQTYRGQITPEKSDAAMETWGVVLDRPHLLLMNEQAFKVGDRLLYGTRLFKVEKGPDVWNAETLTSCVAYMLNEMTPQEGA